MSLIITNDNHYRNIAEALRERFNTDREFLPSEMATVITDIDRGGGYGGLFYTDMDINGKPQTLIYNNWKNSTLTFVGDDLKNNVKKIVCVNCDKVTSVIGQAFYGCAILNSINLPENVTEIDYMAFGYCYSLEHITLSENLISLGNEAFRSCPFKSINLPNDLSYIGRQAFRGCGNLKSINLPKSLNSITNNIFEGCNNLEFVTIENDFNCDNLNLSVSSKYSVDTMVSWLNALADRTGQLAYTLTIGTTNLAKLTDEQKAIAINKNWTLA